MVTDPYDYALERLKDIGIDRKRAESDTYTIFQAEINLDNPAVYRQLRWIANTMSVPLPRDFFKGGDARVSDFLLHVSCYGRVPQ